MLLYWDKRRSPIKWPCWAIILAAVIYADWCLCVEEALQSLLESLTCPPLTPTQHLEREQALAKQVGAILHFTLRFDELKVCRKHLSWTHLKTHTHTHCVPQFHIQRTCIRWVFVGSYVVADYVLVWLQMRIPAIQNDFSYYRRTISRNRINNMNVSWGFLTVFGVRCVWMLCLVFFPTSDPVQKSNKLIENDLFFTAFISTCSADSFSRPDVL